MSARGETEIGELSRGDAHTNNVACDDGGRGRPYEKQSQNEDHNRDSVKNFEEKRFTGLI